MLKLFGCYAERVEKPEDIKPAFKRAVESGKPALIDIIVETYRLLYGTSIR